MAHRHPPLLRIGGFLLTPSCPVKGIARKGQTLSRRTEMNPEEEQTVREIFSRPSNEWTNNDNKYLSGLFKRGLRPMLKKMLAEITLDNNNLEVQNNGV